MKKQVYIIPIFLIALLLLSCKKDETLKSADRGKLIEVKTNGHLTKF